jgi:hypothetical protein
MSQFLGHIHYWLYGKIQRVVQREQMIYGEALALCGTSAEELKEEVWQIYGEPLPERDLGELIDPANIHGWLQRQITIAETREAALISGLLEKCGPTAYDLVKNCFARHGKICGEHAKSQGKYDYIKANGIYQAVNDYLLNGMPCDQGDMMAENSPDHVVWEGAVCLQERNWSKAGVDKQAMKEFYQVWMKGFVGTLNQDFAYRQTADTLKGDRVNRHEIVKE